MTDASDVCGGRSNLDDSEANGHELGHWLIDDSQIGSRDHQTLVFENRNTSLTIEPAFGVEAGVVTSRSSAREPRAR